MSYELRPGRDYSPVYTGAVYQGNQELRSRILKPESQPELRPVWETGYNPSQRLNLITKTLLGGFAAIAALVLGTSLGIPTWTVAGVEGGGYLLWKRLFKTNPQTSSH